MTDGPPPTTPMQAAQKGLAALQPDRSDLDDEARTHLASFTIVPTAGAEITDPARVAAHFPLRQLDIPHADLRAWIDRVDYEATAPAWWKQFAFMAENKMLEHFASAILAGIGPGDTCLDAASSASPFYKAIRQTHGAALCYRQDLNLAKGLREDSIGSDAAAIPLPDGVLDSIVTHNSWEHFEGPSAMGFVAECRRLLRPGGRLCIIPMFLSERTEIWTSPACWRTKYRNAPELPVFDPRATIVIRPEIIQRQWMWWEPGALARALDAVPGFDHEMVDVRCGEHQMYALVATARSTFLQGGEGREQADIHGAFPPAFGPSSGLGAGAGDSTGSSIGGHTGNRPWLPGGRATALLPPASSTKVAPQRGTSESFLPMTDFSRLLTPYEKALLAQAEGWFAEILTAIPYVAPDPEADPRLIVICMTPRSGSTALSGLLWATRALGRGGERLSRTNAFVQRIVAETPPRSRRHLLEMAVNSSRTKNGVGLIKCDLPQILPFLVDADSMALLSQAHFVYLTRGDVLGQAISRYRGIKTGLWHASTGDKGKHVQAEGAPPPEAPYDRAAIQAQIDRITQMMASYERLFALLGIRPLRISYEEVTADPGGVLARIAALVGVDPGPAEQSDSLDAGGFARVGGKNNDDLRSRFLADSRRMLGLAPPPGKGQAPDPAPVPLPRA